MKPHCVSNRLRQIAKAIDNSKNPSAALVVDDMRRIVAAMLDEYEATLMIPSDYVEDYMESPGEWDDYWSDEIRESLSDADVDVHVSDQGIGDYEYWGFKGRDVGRYEIDEVTGPDVRMVLTFKSDGPIPKEQLDIISNGAMANVPSIWDSRSVGDNDEFTGEFLWVPDQSSVQDLGGSDTEHRFSVTFSIQWPIRSR